MYLKSNNYISDDDYCVYIPFSPDTTYINPLTNSCLMVSAGTKTYIGWSPYSYRDGVRIDRSALPEKHTEYYEYEIVSGSSFGKNYNYETKLATTFYQFTDYTKKDNRFLDKIERIATDYIMMSIQYNDKKDFTILFDSIKNNLSYIRTYDGPYSGIVQVWEYGNYMIKITEDDVVTFEIKKPNVVNYIKY